MAANRISPSTRCSHTEVMSKSHPLSPGAQKALIKLANRNSMLPSDDMQGACGPFGPVLERQGLAVPAGKCWGYKLWEPTALGKEEALRLSRLTATKP